MATGSVTYSSIPEIDIGTFTAIKETEKDVPLIYEYLGSCHMRLEQWPEAERVYRADLKKWRVSRNSLISSSPKQYLGTARWAEAIHHQFPRMDGLLWTSNQCDPDTVYVFFGDRVASADFGVTRTRDGQSDAGFLSDVRQAGRRSGIRITV